VFGFICGVMYRCLVHLLCLILAPQTLDLALDLRISGGTLAFW
jgi:hypothetical protein